MRIELTEDQANVLQWLIEAEVDHEPESRHILPAEHMPGVPNPFGLLKAVSDKIEGERAAG